MTTSRFSQKSLLFWNWRFLVPYMASEKGEAVSKIERFLTELSRSYIVLALVIRRDFIQDRLQRINNVIYDIWEISVHQSCSYVCTDKFGPFQTLKIAMFWIV